ncbi:MAG: deoxyribose-phosphate aldolase [Proteobacteria bacterium]|nr:deoxyribose-phosphate aldolase [Pseudomonadota bacterium]
MSCCKCQNGLDVLTIAHPNTKGVADVEHVTPKDLAGIIDHTYLKPDADRAQIEKLCAEAREYHFASVCVNSTMVHLASDLLKDSGVNVCAVIGFPLGAGTTASKVFEAQEAVRCGAVEVDMVINVGALKSKDYKLVEYDIRKVVEGVEGTLVKVIIETCLLTDEEKVIACALSKAAGAHFVKTSTGFSKGGATVEDIALMRRVVGEEMGVKASGGIRDAATAIAMVKAGATRLGVSAGVAIVNSKTSDSDY